MVHPNSLFVRNRAAAVYGVCGETDKAIVQCEAACRMNPLDSKKAATATFSILSFALYMARRFEESIRAGRRALAFTPNTNTARKYVAASLGQLGHVDEARAEIAELLNHQPDASLALFRQHSFRHKWMHELHLEGLRQAELGGTECQPHSCRREHATYRNPPPSRSRAMTWRCTSLGPSPTRRMRISRYQRSKGRSLVMP